MMRYPIIFISILTIIPDAIADFYQCKSDNGKFIFKDTPCAAGETLVRKEIVNGGMRKQRDTHIQDLTGTNLLKNSSFEDRLFAWKVPPEAKWEKNLGINSNAAISIRANRPPIDKYIYETKVEQCVPLGPGTKYEFSAKVKLETIPIKQYANRANVVWYESDDCSKGGQYGNYIEPKDNLAWQDLKRSNLTPSLHARSAKITLVQRGRYSKGGKTLWDDIHFAATEFKPRPGPINTQEYTLGTGINYLTNGSFNAKLSGWRISSKTKWSQFIGNTEPGSARVTSYSSSGSRGSGAFSQCVNFGANKNFELGASVKMDELSTAQGGGRLRLTWYQNIDCKGPAKTDTNWKDPRPVSGWQTLHITGLRAPNNSQSAKIQIIQSIKEEGHYYSYWDDIYFKAIKPGFPSPGE